MKKKSAQIVKLPYEKPQIEVIKFASPGLCFDERITYIGDWSFWEQKDLISIEIPENIVKIGAYAFLDCSNLQEILYKGTKAQWKAIEKGESWDEGTAAYIVHCSDGDLVKS